MNSGPSLSIGGGLGGPTSIGGLSDSVRGETRR